MAIKPVNNSLSDTKISEKDTHSADTGNIKGRLIKRIKGDWNNILDLVTGPLQKRTLNKLEKKIINFENDYHEYQQLFTDRNNEHSRDLYIRIDKSFLNELNLVKNSLLKSNKVSNKNREIHLKIENQIENFIKDVKNDIDSLTVKKEIIKKVEERPQAVQKSKNVKKKERLGIPKQLSPKEIKVEQADARRTTIQAVLSTILDFEIKQLPIDDAVQLKINDLEKFLNDEKRKTEDYKSLGNQGKDLVKQIYIAANKELTLEEEAELFDNIDFFLK